MDVLSCGALAFVEVSILKTQLIGSQGSAGTVICALFFGQYVLAKFFRICVHPRYFSPLRHVPGPENGHFLFGQAINLIQSPVPTALPIAWMKKNPGAPFIRYLTFFNTEVLICNSLVACREVLQTHFYYVPKSNWFIRSTRKIVGKGLLNQRGAEHKAHRRMLAAPFSFGNINRLHPLFKKKAQELSAVLGRAVDQGSTDGMSGVVDCSAVFVKVFLDIIGVAVLGKELAHLDTVGLVQSSKTEKLMTGDVNGKDQGEDHPYRRAFAEFFAPPSKLKQILTFADGFVPVRWIPIQANQDFNSAMGSVRAVVKSLVSERIAEVKKSSTDGVREKDFSTDLLTFIVEESLPGGSAEGMPEDILRDHLLQFIGAGHETSANVLSFCTMVMATRHEIQHKLRTEIQDLLTRSPDPSYAEIDKLLYLENFLKEVMRVYPPPSNLYQQTREGLTIEGIHIPAGTLIDICLSVIHRNPLIWGDDADVVDPDRWVGIPAGDKRLSPFAFETFSNGPRICIGKNFAIVELKTILVELVRNFHFDGVVQEPTYPNPSLVLAPNGLQIRLQRL